MKTTFLQSANSKIRYLALLMFLTLITTNAWGTTATYTITSITAVSLTGTAPANSSASYSQTYSNTAGQATKNNSMTLTLSGYDGCTITGVSVSVRNNKSSGAGFGSLTINGTSKGSLSSITGLGTSWTTKNFTVTSTTVNTNGTVVVQISASANSVFCQSFTITYTAPASTPTLSVSKTSISSGLTYVSGSGPSAAQTFTVSGSNLTANVTITAPTNFEVSKDGSSYAGNQTITTSGTLSATTIYVRLKSGLAVNSYSGNITVASTGATSKTVSLSGSVTAPAYTVQFSTGTGNPTVSSRTEASAGAGITLPSGPTPACSGDGWVFMGWKETSAQSSTTTAPDLLAAGSTYHPASNCTLYAVYYKLADPNPNNFYKVTSNSANLTSGYYIIYANSEAMNNVLTSEKIAGKSVSESSSGVITSTDADIIWTLYKSGDYYQLYNASINKYLEVEGSNNLGLNNTSKGFTLFAFNTSTGQVSFKSVNQTSYQFQYYSGNFSAYGSQSTAIYFYKRGGTYNSNPTCCTALGTINGSIILINVLWV